MTLIRLILRMFFFQTKKRKIWPSCTAEPCLTLVFYECVSLHILWNFADNFSLLLHPQSCHQQGPLLRDAGSQEEEGVIHEETLGALGSPDVAFDRIRGAGSVGPSWAIAEVMTKVCLWPPQGFSLGYTTGLTFGLCRPENKKQESMLGF